MKRYAGIIFAALCLIGACLGVAQAQVVTEFSAGISANAGLGLITAGPDGNLWFAETDGNRIGRITPAGAVTEFSAGISASASAYIFSITTGPDGNLWFTETNGNRVGRISPSGIVTEFSVGLSADASPTGITAGPDGNLWFAENIGNRIGRITPNGVITEFSVGLSATALPAYITAGPDGNLWFTESGIGRITPAGVITEFTGGITSGGVDITTGPDGNLWFTELFGNRLGRITPAGIVTEFSVGLSADAGPAGIIAGPDGNLWFTEFGNRIGRVTPAGVITEFTAGLSADAYPVGITAGSDGNLWFTESGNRIGRITTGAPPPSCSIQVTPFYMVVDAQGDQVPWACDVYNGNTPWDSPPLHATCSAIPPYLRMAQEGCMTTSLAMALSSAGVTTIPTNRGLVSLDPGSLNTFMQANNDYDPKAHVARAAKVTSDVNVATLASRGQKQIKFDESHWMSTSSAYLKSTVCEGHPVIVGVRTLSDCKQHDSVLTGNVGDHFVVVRGEHDDPVSGAPHFDIADPGCRGVSSLDSYGNEFIIRGYVTDPIDVSMLTFEVDGNADLLITDANGNRTGIDPVTATAVEEIPRSSYGEEHVTNIDTGITGEILHSVDVSNPGSTTFQVTVDGLKPGTFDLSIIPVSSDGSPQPPLFIAGIAALGSTSSFQIQYSPVPGVSPNVTVVGSSFVGSVPSSPVPVSGNACDGTYDQTFKGNIMVSSGQTCIFVGGGATGNITVSGGNLVLSNAAVNGNVQINGGGAFFIGSSTHIQGNLTIQNVPSGSGQNQICSSTVDGNLQFQNNGIAVQIGSGPPASCPGNTIGGNLQVTNNTAPTSIFGNLVRGSLQDQNNVGPTQVRGNTVGGDLQCQNNSAITGGRNTAKQKQGQCVGL